jgi:DNA-binding IclR family transcriptional regulator
MGRILSAALPGDQLEKLLFDELVVLTPFTIMDKEVLHGELARIREEGSRWGQSDPAASRRMRSPQELDSAAVNPCRRPAITESSS